MNKKKETKIAKSDKSEGENFGKITSSSDLKGFLNVMIEKMSEEGAAPVYAAGAMNHLLNLPNIYDIMDTEAKELARDIWLRLKAGGMQLRNPPFLFTPEENQQVTGK
jgi:hypothetical protein